MFKNIFIKIALGTIAVIAVLGLLRFKPWQRSASPQAGNEATTARAELNVGFLPVT